MGTTTISFVLTSRRILDIAKANIRVSHKDTLDRIVEIALLHNMTILRQGRFGVSVRMLLSDFELLFGFTPDAQGSYVRTVKLPLDTEGIADNIQIAGPVQHFV